MFILRTYLVNRRGDPIPIATSRYAQSLARRHPMARMASRSARIAHLVVEMDGCRPTGWLDEYYVRVTFTASGHIAEDLVFQDLQAQLRASSGTPPNRWGRGVRVPIDTMPAHRTWLPAPDLRLAVQTCAIADLARPLPRGEEDACVAAGAR